MENTQMLDSKQPVRVKLHLKEGKQRPLFLFFHLYEYTSIFPIVAPF